MIRFQIMMILSAIVCSEALKLSSADLAYKKGVEAYSGERWSECITQFEESLHLYKLHQTITINCRLKCNPQHYDSHLKEDIEDLKMYEKFFYTRDCLNKCRDKEFQEVRLNSDIPDSLISNMQRRTPYDYLHVCYFQMNALPKAASAAYTYLLANPEDENMKNNLQYYAQQPEVDIKEVEDLLSEDYMVLYRMGMKAYNKSNWGETAANLEEVLTDYLLWENKCRVECERQPEQEWSPEFVTTISNNIASLLYCRQQCQEKLKTLGYQSGIEFLADVLNYLQISYYHLDKINDAARSVASYLALFPNDEDILENKKIYSFLVEENAFNVRSDIIYYAKRDKYEKILLELFHWQNNDLNNNTI